MGNENSIVAPGPKTFYLVHGGPPIVYKKGPHRGPLIFNVERMERTAEPVQAAESRDCPVYCSAKQPFKLVPVGRNSREGFRLQFDVSSVACPMRLTIYVGVKVVYRQDGVSLKSGGDGRQYVVHESLLQPGSNLRFNEAHRPILLQDLLGEEAIAMSEGVGQRIGSSQIVAEFSPPDSSSSLPTLRCFLAFSKFEMDGEEAPTVPVVCRKQYLCFQTEVFEMDDVFDIGGRSDKPSNADDTQRVADTVEVDDDDDDSCCVVCLTNPRDTTIMPCRHMCVCSECATALKQQSGKCPMCRKEIEQLMTLA